jgi:hypothetical protein
MKPKRRPPEPGLPLDYDWRSCLKRAGQPSDEPPAAEPTTDPKQLTAELARRLSARHASTSRVTTPSCPPRPAPIATRPRRYKHLATPLETLERMAAAGDRAAAAELAMSREARQRQQTEASGTEAPETVEVKP